MLLALKQQKNSHNLVTRFAPAPTGPLHLGHLLSALYVWSVAKEVGAKIVLRLEDHDRQRSKKEFYAPIFNILSWFGLKADLGLTNNAAILASTQQNNLSRYQTLVYQLYRKNLIYPCFCSRQEIHDRMAKEDNAQPHSNQVSWNAYDGKCRAMLKSFVSSKNTDQNQSSLLPEAIPGSMIRLIVRDTNYTFRDLLLGEQVQNPNSLGGDFPLIDKRNNFTYQLSVVSDDIAHKINLVIRGQDILESTGRQLCIYEYVDKQPPLFYLHHPLIIDENTGKKLSKIDHSTSLQSLIDKGLRSDQIIAITLKKAGFTGINQELKLEEAFAIILRSLD